MTKIIAFAFAGLASLATPVFAQSSPPTKLVVIDKVAIMQGSKVGQDVARQVQAIAKQAQTDLTAQGRAIQEEERTAVQQTAILAPDAKAKRMAGIEAKKRALQASAQKKDEQIKAGFFQARQQMEQALGPILQEVVKEQGANIVVGRNYRATLASWGADEVLTVLGRLLERERGAYWTYAFWTGER
ncbi:MAG: OmpH family outer membrane protein, partial [Pseudomonadota bacterium]